MQINVNAQADHPLFVWSLLLLKSENQFFFFYLIYRRITGEPEVAEHFETWGGGGGSSSTQLHAYHYSNFLKCPLCCLLTQAIFTMSSVSVINL